MNKLCRLLLIAFVCCKPALSQAQLVFQGKIEYERKVNLYKRFEHDNEWVEQFKARMPKLLSNYFNLSFTTHKSIYEPGREVELPKVAWGMPPGAENIVVQDYDHRSVTASKSIFEQKFLIADTMKAIRWRITDEIRTIADFKCRKAVGKICDSVYVVAFYTDDIAVSGGPEQFGGLPGMILELAVPRLFAIWVATKVELVPVKEETMVITAKGKKMTHSQLQDKITLSMKDWGKYGAQSVWWSAL